ncbi:MAG: LysR substrate-binding domain-containing protein [Pseudomonas sp.]|nr:LysR substrate-binding domain-containing protein [Pseudomonas sp.]MDP3813697.1 LysR substrate-binding domain-containing protein [Pseudomonas sp.]
MLEDIASGRLPHALRRFATAYPQVALELVIDNSATLASQLNNAELDLAIGDASYFSATASALWQQPLHWVAARGFDLQAHAQALPIVAFGGNCLWQAQVFEALKLAARPWRVVCTSNSLAAVQSAVEAGLGIAVLLRSNIRPESMRTLNGEGLPEAPQVSFGLYERSQIDPAPAVSTLRNFLAEELHVQPPLAATATPQPRA